MAEEKPELESSDTVEDSVPTEKFDVVYACLRCSTGVSNSELSRLQEIKCIFFLMVFTKVINKFVK